MDAMHAVRRLARLARSSTGTAGVLRHTLPILVALHYLQQRLQLASAAQLDRGITNTALAAPPRESATQALLAPCRLSHLVM